MPASKTFLSAVKTVLSEHANDVAAPKMQAYMKSAMPYYGINAPQQKHIFQQIILEHPLTSYQQWQDTVLSLWRNAKFREERYAAIALCNAKAYESYQTLETLPVYEELIITGAWWDLVDGLAPSRFRHLLAHWPKETKKVLLSWASSDDLWKRRSAIIAQLKRKEQTDLTLLYACIEPSLLSKGMSKEPSKKPPKEPSNQLHDQLPKEFFLRKAIGWALRDYAWVDFAEIEQYVVKNSDRLSPLSQKEALKNRLKVTG